MFQRLDIIEGMESYVLIVLIKFKLLSIRLLSMALCTHTHTHLILCNLGNRFFVFLVSFWLLKMDSLHHGFGVGRAFPCH